jgi:hypothetical protein
MKIQARKYKQGNMKIRKYKEDAPALRHALHCTALHCSALHAASGD